MTGLIPVPRYERRRAVVILSCGHVWVSDVSACRPAGWQWSVSSAWLFTCPDGCGEVPVGDVIVPRP